jgi:serine/threonine protein kinase
VAVILEFMNLGGLDNVQRKAPGKCIPEKVLAAMAYQILFGLGYLEFERRVHRDIKPQNILVNTTGRVKLTDFGISRELSTAVLAKTFIGSFKYMSPERILHQPYDYASDIWSLGR